MPLLAYLPGDESELGEEARFLSFWKMSSVS